MARVAFRRPRTLVLKQSYVSFGLLDGNVRFLGFVWDGLIG